MSGSQGTDYFFRNHPLTRWQVRASLRVRRQVYEWFRRMAGGVSGKTVLEHGATPDTERGDSNCFIRWLLDDGATVLAASPEDISVLPEHFPGLGVVPWPIQPGDVSSVDLIISSAVLEHVGAVERQQQYIEDLLALPHSGILLTTPNRGHWLEFHTKLPLLHWLPRGGHRRLLGAAGLRFWSREENLRLVSRGDLERLIAAAARDCGQSFDAAWLRPRFLGLTSNLVAFLRPV